MAEAGLGYPIKLPKSYTPGRKSGQPSVIVLHTTEGSEGPQSAEDGAAYDARRTDGTSTHFFVDSNSIVQCVPTYDEAHAARAHGNDVGIQIEICGKAGQGSAGWSDAVSKATLELVAQLCVRLRAKYPGRFPVRRLSPSSLRAGAHGFAGHVDCTNAWPEDGGTHTDPGPTFPWAAVLARIVEIESGDDVSKADVTAGLIEFFARDADSEGKNVTSKIGRDALDQYVPNPFAGGKTFAWQLQQNTAMGVQRIEAALAALADPVKLATAVSATLVPAVLAALQAAGATGLTAEQVEDAAEQAVRTVLGAVDQ